LPGGAIVAQSWAIAMSIDLRFFLGWREYYAAQRFFRRSRGEVPMEYPLAAAFLAVAAVLWAAAAPAGIALACLAAGAGAMLLAPWLRRLEVKRRWAREPIYQTEHVVSAGEQGLHYLMGWVESNLGWSYYQRWLETPEGFLLVYGDDSFNLLPKRAFASAEMMAEFRLLAAQNLKSDIR
jgi:hypothetical protein